MGDSAVFFVGQTTSRKRYVTAEVIEAFARVSGDTNPVHLDDAYAATTRFGKRIAHGMLVTAFVSAILGTEFPGYGTIYLGQNLQFLRPVHIDDTLEIILTVTNFRADKSILTIDTTVRNQRNEKVLTGEAVCLVSELVAAATYGNSSGAAAS